jgi:hypothetical protein
LKDKGKRVTVSIDRCLLEDLREHQAEYQLLDDHELVKLKRFKEGPSYRILVEKVIIRYINARSEPLQKQ